ncbi:MAG: UPF0175 family protein [Candidatus Geothermarchaeales archaeon]
MRYVKILEMYSSGEISAGKASGMLGVPRAAFYEILAERKTPSPKKLSESILKELRELGKNM